MQSLSVFLDTASFLISGEKMLMSTELKGYVTWFIYFLDPLSVRYNFAKFHHCRICVTDFTEGVPFCPPAPPTTIPEQPQKSPSWIGLNLLSRFHKSWIWRSFSRLTVLKFFDSACFLKFSPITKHLWIPQNTIISVYFISHKLILKLCREASLETRHFNLH